MASYPVPGAEYRDFELAYAVLSKGCVMYHHTEANFFMLLTRDDYEQFEALYPDVPKMDPSFLADNSLDELDGGDDEACANEALEAMSDASSEFISDPDEAFSGDDSNNTYDSEAEICAPSPYARPPNPEPPTPNPSWTRDTAVYMDSESDGGTDMHPLVRFPTTPTRASKAPNATTAAETEANPAPPMNTIDNSHQCTTVYEADFDFEKNTDTPMHPTSPYRQRASPLSWTGLDKDTWGVDSYLACDGTMGLHMAWTAETGACHGQLQHCAWGGYVDRDQVAPSAGPELKLTTAEGEEYWLDDCFQRHEEHNDEGQQQDYVREYDHTCTFECADFFERFGWGLFPEGQDTTTKIEGGLQRGPFIDAQMAQYDAENNGDLEQGEDGQFMEAKVGLFSRRLLETVPEEDEDAVSEISELQEVDHDMLDRFADVVFGECELRKAKAAVANEEVREEAQPAKTNGGVKELPRWMQDHTYVSNERWADMVEEDEEE